MEPQGFIYLSEYGDWIHIPFGVRDLEPQGFIHLSEYGDWIHIIPFGVRESAWMHKLIIPFGVRGIGAAEFIYLSVGMDAYTFRSTGIGAAGFVL